MNENTQITNSTPEAAGGRTFTQQQVNAIVSDRLAREREKLADENEYKAKYERVLAELEGIKANQLHQQKKAAYRDLLTKANISEKYIAAVLKVSAAEIDGLELDKSGKAADSDKLVETIKNEWADFVVTTEIRGTDVPHPPLVMRTCSEDEIANAFKPKI